jgi:hypothetical protein
MAALFFVLALLTAAGAKPGDLTWMLPAFVALAFAIESAADTIADKIADAIKGEDDEEE